MPFLGFGNKPIETKILNLEKTIEILQGLNTTVTVKGEGEKTTEDVINFLKENYGAEGRRGPSATHETYKPDKSGRQQHKIEVVYGENVSRNPERVILTGRPEKTITIEYTIT